VQERRRKGEPKGEGKKTKIGKKKKERGTKETEHSQ